MALFLVGCGGATSDSNLKDIYKELDALDFKTQEEVANVEKVNADLAKIYAEPQLSRAKDYLDQMRQKGVKFVLKKVDYKRIDIINKSEETATLVVENVTNGDIVSLTDPKKTLETVKDNSNVLQIRMVKKGGNWLISEIEY